MDVDQQVRLAALEWLAKQVELHGEVLPRDLLAAGFKFQGERIPLVSPQGIFKPHILPDIPLSITTTQRVHTTTVLMRTISSFTAIGVQIRCIGIT